MDTNLLISVGGRTNADVQNIILLKADVNYTEIYYSDGKLLIVATPLKELEKRFALCSNFFRPHKSFMVNIDYVRFFDTKIKDPYMEMKNDFRVAIARRKKTAFRKKIYQHIDP